MTDEPEKSKYGLVDKAKLGMVALSLGFQQSPGNEAARAYIGTNILAVTHNPILVGGGVGLATVLIEGASSLTVADALNSHPEWVGWLKKKMRGDNDDTSSEKSNRGTDIALALGVGTAAVVMKRHYQEKDRTFQKDKKIIAKTAGGIALFSAGIGMLASGGIEYADKIGLGSESEALLDVASSWKTYAGLFVATQAYKGIKHGVNSGIKRKAVGKQHYESGFLSDGPAIKKALELEQRVWDEEGYGSLDVYKKYEPQSRVFGAFKADQCIGITRLFAGAPELPPFLEEMPFDNPELRTSLLKGAKNGLVEELGTVAIDKKASKELGAKRLQVALGLWRLAYRDAYERGIESWGIIMEPERVEKMNRFLGFTFKQVGPVIEYQGGGCAAHLMDLNEVRGNMEATNPNLYGWFVNEPLTNPIPPATT